MKPTYTYKERHISFFTMYSTTVCAETQTSRVTQSWYVDFCGDSPANTSLIPISFSSIPSTVKCSFLLQQTNLKHRAQKMVDFVSKQTRINRICRHSQYLHCQCCQKILAFLVLVAINSDFLASGGGILAFFSRGGILEFSPL